MATHHGSRRDFSGMKQRRMRAAKLFEQGVSQAEVARRLQVSRTSVMRWHQAWRKDGVAGLAGAGRAGRRPKLTPPQIAQLEAQLLRGPKAHGHQTELWTLPRISAVIEKLTGVRYHPGHVWRILQQLGWSA